MPPFQPKRAFLGGVTTAAPLALTSGILFELGGSPAAFGFYPLLLLPYLTGIVAGWFLHGVVAVVFTAALSAAFIFLVGFFTLGAGIFTQSGSLQMLLLCGVAVGPIAGLLTRPLVRKRISIE